MKIVALQWNSVWQDSQANLQQLKLKLAKLLASTSGPVDLVVLPELFHGGFSMQPARFAESINGEVSQVLAALAKQHSVNIVAGVAQKQVRRNCHGDEVKFYNRALAFDKQGQQIGCYSKQKAFSYADEQKFYIAGHQAEIVEIEQQPFALFICYDLRFPELFRKVAKQVKGVIVIANWPKSRQTHWQILLKARAIENQCFVVGVNRIGSDANNLDYIGGSSVISPLGEQIAFAGESNSLVSEIDISQVDEVRQQFPFLDDMTTN